MSLKEKLFCVIQPDNGTSRLSRLFDFSITVLILLSVVSVFVGTFDLPADVQQGRERFEAIASLIFTVEYLLRIWTANLLHPGMSGWKARIRYLVSPMAIIDLVAILPFWLPMLLPGHMLGVRALRLVRLLRVLKLNRYFDAVHSIADVIVEKKRELIGSMFFVGLVMMVASLLMFSVEHTAQPNVFKNAFSGLWWAVATLTTVGYGDIYPITVLGRILGSLIAFTGVAALAIPTGIITSGLMERVSSAKIDAEAEKRATKDTEHDAELERQRTKDDEHDTLLRRQQEMLQKISDQLAELSQQKARQHKEDVL